MIRTGIPVSVWDSEPVAVAATAARLLNRAAAPDDGREVLVSG